MKLMIASDIHGSAFYCKELLKAFENEHADKILLLGDILYHGPRNDLPKEYNPKQVIELLNGISDEILAKADKLVIIPMHGKAESLNASVSGAILMYEHLRQNRK